jgi:hypothetical protein
MLPYAINFQEYHRSSSPVGNVSIQTLPILAKRGVMTQRFRLENPQQNHSNLLQHKGIGFRRWVGTAFSAVFFAQRFLIFPRLRASNGSPFWLIRFSRIGFHGSSFGAMNHSYLGLSIPAGTRCEFSAFPELLQNDPSGFHGVF